MDNETVIARRLCSWIAHASLVLLLLLSASLSSVPAHAQQVHRQAVPVIDEHKWYYLVPMLIKQRAMTFRASEKWDWAILTEGADPTYSQATPVQFIPTGNGTFKICLKRSHHGTDWTYLTQGKSGVYLNNASGASVWNWINDDHDFGAFLKTTSSIGFDCYLDEGIKGPGQDMKKDAWLYTVSAPRARTNPTTWKVVEAPGDTQ